jgi:hypothetical protein
MSITAVHEPSTKCPLSGAKRMLIVVGRSERDFDRAIAIAVNKSQYESDPDRAIARDKLPKK